MPCRQYSVLRQIMLGKGVAPVPIKSPRFARGLNCSGIRRYDLCQAAKTRKMTGHGAGGIDQYVVMLKRRVVPTYDQWFAVIFSHDGVG